MKKGLLVALGATLALGVTACGGKKTPSIDVTTTTTAMTTTSANASTTSSAATTTTSSAATTTTTSVAQTTTATATTATTIATTTTSVNNSNVTTGEFETPEIPAVTNKVSTAKISRKEFDNNLKKDGPVTQDAFPSLGSPKLLVIPVNLDNSKATTENINDIKIAFNGTEEQTGWESVKTFYQKSSYNKLTIDSIVLDDWFTPKYSAEYYNTHNFGDLDPSEVILEEALTNYDNQIDFSQYDYDKDGLIDGVWLIYNHSVDYSGSDSIYWAYKYWSSSETYFDNVQSCNYAFAGTDFMHPDQENEIYDVSDIKVDAHTFIHETGHMLGLDDYYDYNPEKGPTGGLYGADMMDGNIGDHGVMSKLLVGWITPYVLTGSGELTVDLNSFTETGDCIIVADHELTSIYDEFFIIEFYTESGLNAHDLPIFDEEEYVYGIRIIHVNAVKYINSKGEEDFNDDDSYSTGFKYDNSGTSKLFINHLRADNSTDTESIIGVSSLYTDSSNVFGVDSYSNYKLDNGNSLFFTVKVNSIGESNASVTFDVK